MPFFITNPLGFLALLGIPVILLIHYLQRRSQVIPCSTLFLLRQTQKESNSGRKFDKLIQSLALWMQLLIVLLITLLLIKPRYVKSHSSQRIAIVLDSSASMSVFRDKVKDKVMELLPELQGQASHIEVWLLDSDLSKDRVYHGNSAEELQLALDQWQPQSGTSNPHHVLRIGRSLCGHDGALVYLTDTPTQSAPYQAAVHSVGSAQQNVGFTGVQYDSDSTGLRWKASIRNYSTQPVSRTWRLQTDQQQQSEQQTVTLAAGELKILSGNFPEEATRARLSLSPDSFTYDDVLPLIRPKGKELALHLRVAKHQQERADKIASSFDHLAIAANADTADLICASYGPESESFGLEPAIVFLSNPKTTENYQAETIIATEHPLTEGLNWQKLLLSGEPRFTLGKWDTPLVWAGKEAVVFLREVPIGLGDTRPQLVLNFDISHSNAFKQECFALLLYRFLESQRQAKDNLTREITELGQPLTLNIDRNGKQVVTEIIDLDGRSIESHSSDPKHPLSAPDEVGLFTVKQGDKTLLEAANIFADTREADLSTCDSGELKSSQKAAAVDRHSDEDHLWRVWVLLSLLALMMSWKNSKEPTTV